MFFLLSKILDFLIAPITWIVVVLAIAVFTKNTLRKRKTLIVSFVGLLIFSNPLIFSVCRNLIPSCDRVVSDNKKEHFHAAILLGGMISYDESKDRILFNANINRLHRGRGASYRCRCIFTDDVQTVSPVLARVDCNTRTQGWTHKHLVLVPRS